MVDPRKVHLWLHRGGFVVICAAALFFSLLPLSAGIGHWPGPDLMLGFAIAWVLRRPEYVPVALVALVLLVADFIYMRPPGLYAVLCVLTIEFLRRREPQSRDMPFLLEWAMVAVVMFGLAIGYRLMLGLFMVDQASLGLVILQQISTLLAYPVVVLFSTQALRITKISASEADQMGRAR